MIYHVLVFKNIVGEEPTNSMLRTFGLYEGNDRQNAHQSLQSGRYDDEYVV